jgi:hypothetical protein
VGVGRIEVSFAQERDGGKWLALSLEFMGVNVLFGQGEEKSAAAVAEGIVGAVNGAEFAGGNGKVYS